MISDDMQQALYQQLNDEFYSSYLYLAMSAYCAHIDFSGAANWLKQQYEEEQMHATKIYNYLIDQGAHVVLDEIPKPPVDYGTRSLSATFPSQQRRTAAAAAGGDRGVLLHRLPRPCRRLRRRGRAARRDLT